MVGQFAQTQNALLQGQLIQQTVKARQTIGQLVGNSANDDGSPNWNRALPQIFSHPDTAWMAPQFANELATNGRINAETANLQLAMKGERAGRLAGILLGAGKDQSIEKPGDMANYISQAHAEGALVDEDEKQGAISWLSDSKTGIGNLRGQELRQAITNHGLALLHANTALSAASSNFGKIGTSPTGDDVLGWTNPPRGSAQDVYGRSPFGPAPASVEQAGGVGGAMGAGPTTGAAAARTAQAAPGGETVIPGSPGPLRQQQLKDAGDYRVQAGHEAEQYANLVNQINIVKRYQRSVGSGKFSEQRTDLANSLRTAGFSKDIYNAVGNGDLATSQALMKQFMNGAIGSIANIVHTQAPGSRLGQQETMTYINRGAPNFDMVPESIDKVNSAAKEVAHYMMLRHNYVEGRWRQPGYDPVNAQYDWPDVYNKLVEEAH
jgi:hypothetical protein